MNRRKALKTLMAIGAISVTPRILQGANASPPQTHFIGLGKSGSFILEYFYRQNPKAKFTCLSYLKARNKNPNIHYIQTNQLINHTGKTPHNYLGADDKIKLNNEVVEIFNSDDQFVLLAGLSGFSGSSLTKDLTLKLHASNKHFKTICSLPYKFEGTKRRIEALAVIHSIGHLPEVKYLDQEYLRQKYSDLRLSNCFDLTNMELWNIYKSF